MSIHYLAVNAKGRKNLPEASKESTAVEIGQSPGTRLQSTAQTEQHSAQGNGLATTQVITTGTSEASTEESAGGKHGDYQTTARGVSITESTTDTLRSDLCVELAANLETKDSHTMTSAITPRSSWPS